MAISNESLKEYYVKLQGLYDNAYNLLTAINQSLSTNAPEITVDVVDTDDATTTLRIPSFLYLENRLEQIENNMSNLFSMPDSGEAWFNKSSDMYKLKLVRSSTAPVIPSLNTDDIYAGFRDTSILKDLVSPHTYLRMQVDNLPECTSEMFMRKVIIHDKATFDALSALDIRTYDEWQAALYRYRKGEDYEEYDSTIKLPIKKDTYKSLFEIDEVTGEPWLDPTDNNHKHMSYRLRLSTLEYTDEEDSAIRFTLRPGDYLCLGNEMVIYLVKNVDTSSNSVVIEETVGHIALQTYEENSQMVLTLYNDNYGKYKYVDVPLEENRYVCIFLGVIYNNVRSILSDAYLIDLNTIYVRNDNGDIVKDEYGNPMSYMDYYNKYCTNIGDLILGLTEAAYPQLSNYPGNVLRSLQEDETLQTAVSATIDPEEILQVVPINKHLVDDTSSQDIINLHSQKNNIQAQLQTVNDNISQTYNTLTSTDFSQETANSMSALQSKLQTYYTERTTLQKQLNSIIDSINAKALDVTVSGNDVKYRIRGIAETDALEELVHSMADDKADIIGMEIEYKYKSTTKDTNTLNVINSSTFTDWTRQAGTIDRQRKLVFDNNVRSWHLQYIDYKSTDNIIKWNQIDIPIKGGEDVIVRVRYKYNIGQPFVTLVTPWSDEMTVHFPPEYLDTVEMDSIIDTNRQDTVVAGFRDILINEGYEEHITNKLVASDQVFYHMPENIYSGFNTSENNLISLKDKLLQMSQDLEQYKSWVNGESNANYEVYLQYDNQSILLAPNNINKINIFNTDHVSGTFIKKNMNIVIKNTGNTRVNFYSIFPGNTQISLLKSNIESYNSRIGQYERVPLIIDNTIAAQNLGQWIYFRQTNPYTGEDIYRNTAEQIRSDRRHTLDASEKEKTDVKHTHVAPDFVWMDDSPAHYMMEPNSQCLLAYRDRKNVKESDDFKEITNEYVLGLVHMFDYTQMLRENLTLAMNTIQSLRLDHNLGSEQRILDYSNEIFDQDNLNPYMLDDETGESTYTKYWDQEFLDPDNPGAYLKLNEQDHVRKFFYMNNREMYEHEQVIEKALNEFIKNYENLIYADVYNNYYEEDFIYENSIYKEGLKVKSDDITNNYLLRYEDIRAAKANTAFSTVTLDSSTSIQNFISTYDAHNGFEDEASFCGAFLYPELLSRASITTEGGENDHLYIDEGEQLSVPIVFEYFLDGDYKEPTLADNKKIDHTKVKKSIYFDIKPSLIKDITHYMIEITGNYDVTASGDMYNGFANVDLDDAATGDGKPER